MGDSCKRELGRDTRHLQAALAEPPLGYKLNSWLAWMNAERMNAGWMNRGSTLEAGPVFLSGLICCRAESQLALQWLAHSAGGAFNQCSEVQACNRKTVLLRCDIITNQGL